MYVCLCAGVTDKEIVEAVAEGCCSIEALQDHLAVGKNCGQCRQMAEQIVEETLNSLYISKNKVA